MLYMIKYKAIFFFLKWLFRKEGLIEPKKSLKCMGSLKPPNQCYSCMFIEESFETTKQTNKKIWRSLIKIIYSWDRTWNCELGIVENKSSKDYFLKISRSVCSQWEIDVRFTLGKIKEGLLVKRLIIKVWWDIRKVQGIV